MRRTCRSNNAAVALACMRAVLPRCTAHGRPSMKGLDPLTMTIVNPEDSILHGDRTIPICISQVHAAYVGLAAGCASLCIAHHLRAQRRVSPT